MTGRGLDALPAPVADVVATAAGMAHRDDPVAPRTGGPAGNARLTAWLGLLLLAAFLVELFTLVSLNRLVSVHIFVGTLLVPLALLKTATTTWRMLGYYAGADRYRQAGPPPMLLRVLGPAVVFTALAVLGTGLALIALGRDRTYQPFATVAGNSIDPFTLHKVAFVLWLAVTTAHTLGRLVPAVQLIVNRAPRSRVVPGKPARLGLLLAAVAISAIAGAIVLSASGSWTNGFDQGDDSGSAHIQDH
jgi:hypothetical protein